MCQWAALGGPPYLFVQHDVLPQENPDGVVKYLSNLAALGLAPPSIFSGTRWEGLHVDCLRSCKGPAHLLDRCG